MQKKKIIFIIFIFVCLLWIEIIFLIYVFKIINWNLNRLTIIYLFHVLINHKINIIKIYNYEKYYTYFPTNLDNYSFKLLLKP